MLKTGFEEINLERFKDTSVYPWYLELAITGNCNFKCKYCNRFSAHSNLDQLKSFFKENITKDRPIKRIQITGGEPSVHENFQEIMTICKENTIDLGLSTNGSADLETYLNCGANIFYISLDDYDLDILKERGYVNPQKIIDNIRSLSKLENKKVSIGLVVDRINCSRIEKIIEFILGLGVDDVRLSISTHDYVKPVFEKSYEKYPTLNYRIENFKKGINMRGRLKTSKCHLAVNDLCIVGDKHYPCLVYFREKGKAIGNIDSDVMKERQEWFRDHDAFKDDICKKYCMDFKCDANYEIEKLEK
jgi:MoaA/NifB/PqqE/SkfB family radical SAM enzyme